MAEPALDPVIKLDYLGGMCPVQAEGTMDDIPFYFRARGTKWKLYIGVGAPLTSPLALHAEGDHPAAGWMREDEVHAILHQYGRQWKAQQVPAPQRS